MKKPMFIASLYLLYGCTDSENSGSCQDFPDSYIEVHFEHDSFQNFTGTESQIYKARSEVAQCYAIHPYGKDMYVINYETAREMNGRNFLFYDIEDLSGLHLLFEFDESGKISGSFANGLE